MLKIIENNILLLLGSNYAACVGCCLFDNLYNSLT
jgi:hypothetical protein